MNLQLPALNTVYHGDSRSFLRGLPSNSVHCGISSPPYFNQRNYAEEGQIGLEGSVREYIDALVEVFREFKRVLRDDGTLWVNLGESYAVSGKGAGGLHDPSNSGGKAAPRTVSDGNFKPKDMLGIPWRFAFAMQDDGWYLRSECIWYKGMVIPSSVKDRPTRDHEYVFLFAKSEQYWYDREATREKASDSSMARISQKNFTNQTGGPKDYGTSGVNKSRSSRTTLENFAKNPGRYMRTVWKVNPEPSNYDFCSNCETLYAGKRRRLVIVRKDEDGKKIRICPTCSRNDAWVDHFAAFPRKLVRRMLLPGCPLKVCSECGAPYVRVFKAKDADERNSNATDHAGKTGSNYSEGSNANRLAKLRQAARERGEEYQGGKETIGWKPTCNCNSDVEPGIVLDPFMGSGTVGLTAKYYGYWSLGCDLNSQYVKLANARLQENITPTMFPYLEEK